MTPLERSAEQTVCGLADQIQNLNFECPLDWKSAELILEEALDAVRQVITEQDAAAFNASMDRIGESIAYINQQQSIIRMIDGRAS